MSTAAHGEESSTYLETEGVLWLDMLPLIKKSFPALSSYRLQAVAEEFLGSGKDPVSVSDIVEGYRIGVLGLPPRSKNWEKLRCPAAAAGAAGCATGPGAGARCGACRAAVLGVIGRYCVVDAELCIDLMRHHNTWISLAEMSAICDTSIFDLCMRGQQARVYAQIYRQCAAMGRVTERPLPGQAVRERYQGAYVKEPSPGLYKNVVPFDFLSLYPSSIISENIDFSTYLVPGTCDDVPDSACHVIAWYDHTACAHGKGGEATCARGVHHSYRFIRETAGAGGVLRRGVLPEVVSGLLRARQRVRREMAALEREQRAAAAAGAEGGGGGGEHGSPAAAAAAAEAASRTAALCVVLDARQKAYKICANAAYGGLGASHGPLTFRIGAMATTAVGRLAFAKVERLMARHGGIVVYGDTVPPTPVPDSFFFPPTAFLFVDSLLLSSPHTHRTATM
jgi:hypothetical protein